jgi:hypothetical protein
MVSESVCAISSSGRPLSLDGLSVFVCYLQNTSFRALQVEKMSELVAQTIAGNFSEVSPFNTYSSYLQMANAHTSFATELRSAIENTLENLRHVS